MISENHVSSLQRLEKPFLLGRPRTGAPFRTARECMVSASAADGWLSRLALCDLFSRQMLHAQDGFDLEESDEASDESRGWHRPGHRNRPPLTDAPPAISTHQPACGSRIINR